MGEVVAQNVGTRNMEYLVGLVSSGKSFFSFFVVEDRDLCIKKKNLWGIYRNISPLWNYWYIIW